VHQQACWLGWLNLLHPPTNTITASDYQTPSGQIPLDVSERLRRERLWEKEGFKTRVENVVRNVKSIAYKGYVSLMYLSDVFITRTPSVCRLSVCLLRSCTVLRGWSVRQYFFAAVYLSHSLTSKILRRSSGDVKRKRGSKIERWSTYRRLYLNLINGTRYGLGYN